MNAITKYSGISAITVSLFMLTLGSIPTSFAGQVDSTLNVNISCGLVVADGTIIWDDPLDPNSGVTLDSTVGADFSGTQPTATNPAINTAHSNVSANVGDSNTGGYAGTTDGLTHIQPSEMSLDLVNDVSGGLVAMDNGGANIKIGTLAPDGVADTIQLRVDTSNIVNTPLTDATWTAQINLIASCVVL